MKQLFILVFIVLCLASCRSSKEVTSVSKVESKKISVSSKEIEHVDTKTLIRERTIKPDEIVSKTDLDLKNIDLIKQLFTKDSPLIKIDSVTNTIIESYIDLDNVLHQRIKTIPNEIKVSDTTIEKLKNRLLISDSTNIKETTRDSVHSEIIKPAASDNLGFFGRIWLFIKNFFFIIIVVIIIGIVVYLNSVFNLTGIIKKLFNK